MRRMGWMPGLLAAGAMIGSRQAAPVKAAPAEKGLLVIAPERFHPALQEFVRFKNGELPTRLVSLERVLATSRGEDDPARVKHFLYDAWKQEGADYALLVGDADAFPVRYMVLDRVTPAAYNYAFYPSDLYYSDLAKADGAFDDWNAQKDGFHAGYYGEVRGEKNKIDPMNFDGVDYRPDIAVGRWPVSSVEEVRTVAEKTVAYEQGLRSGRKEGERRAAFFSVGGWVDSRGVLDAMAGELSHGWQVEKRYYRGGGRDDGTPPPVEPQLDALLNSGLGVVFHAGHGSDDTWQGCFAVPHLDRVTNRDRLPVIVSAGCSTARLATLPPYEPYVDVNGAEHAGTDHGEVFSGPPAPPATYQKGKYNPTGLGEQLLRRGPDGAVAYIGCNTGSQPCGLTLLRGFAEALATEKQPRVGDCWAHAVSYYFDHEHLATLKPTSDWYPASIFFQGMKFMLYGDPSLRMPAVMAQPAGGK